jgi:hypothetical protein
LSANLQDRLLDGLKPKLIAQLYDLDESATDSDVAQLCERISDPLRAAFVYDVVCLLLCGDIAAAEARFDLEAGAIRVAPELRAPELLEIRDGDIIRSVVIGSDEHAWLLEQLARDLPHYDCLLFMHP